MLVEDSEIEINKPYADIGVIARDVDHQVFYCSHGNEQYLGVCFIARPLIGADQATVDRIMSSLSTPMPEGAFIQLGLLATPDIEDRIAGYLHPKMRAGGIIDELILQHAQFIGAGALTPLVAASGVLANHKRLIFTVKYPIAGQPSETQIREVSEKADRIAEALSSAKLDFNKADASAYLMVLRFITNVYEPRNIEVSDLAPLNEQAFYPGDEIRFGRDIISFNRGRHFAKIMSVKKYPKVASLGAMAMITGDTRGLDNQITDAFYMVLTIRYPDQVAKADWVRNKSSWINHQVFGGTAHLIPVLGYKKRGIDTLIHEMDGKGAVLCEMNLSLMLFGKDESELEKKAASLSAYYTSLGLQLRPDSRILKPLFYSLLPLNACTEGIRNLKRFVTRSINQAICFAPIIADWCGNDQGGLLLLNRKGELSLVDLFSSQTNMNATIFAEAGAGKSFLTQALINAYLSEGAKVWAIDVGRSYFKEAKLFGGLFMEFSQTSNICMNPFSNIKGNLEEEMDLLVAIIGKMASPNDGLDDFKIAALQEAITSVYETYQDNATIEAIAEYFTKQTNEELQKLGKQLYPFAQGTYAPWFNGVNNINMDSDYIVLELEELKSRQSLQQVVLLQLIARINYEIFLNPGRRKLLIIDEAWELLNDPMMAKALEALYRKARKYGAAIVIVTQSIADLYRSENAQAISENSAWQFILQQKAESIDAAIKTDKFSIDSYGAALLKSVHTSKGHYSEMMVKNGNSYGVFRLVVSRFTQVAFSTSGDERTLPLQWIDEGMDPKAAIDQYILERG